MFVKGELTFTAQAKIKVIVLKLRILVPVIALNYFTAVQHRRAEWNDYVEQHFTRATFIVSSPLFRTFDNLILLVDYKGVSVSSNGIIARLEKFHPRCQKARKPHIIRS